MIWPFGEKQRVMWLLATDWLAIPGLEAVPTLHDEITLKILVGLALASNHSIYLLQRRTEMLGGIVFSGEIGTGNFSGNLEFLNFPFPGNFMSGSREIFFR